VKQYLKEFLNDPEVMDIGAIKRYFIVNWLIIPFRAKESAKLYKEIWTKEGSPLLIHSNNVKDKLQDVLGDNYIVSLGMCYCNPNLRDSISDFVDQDVEKIIVVPMYPQYAFSSTGASITNVKNAIKKQLVKAEVTYIDQFYDRPDFQEALLEKAKQYDISIYDHFVFSFHGIPERQVKNLDKAGTCQFNKECCSSINKNNHHCYRATCHQTARTLAEQLEIPENKYSITFQSRLGKDPWIKPYTDFEFEALGKKGVENVLAFSPAFVADCLETVYEIGTEIDELFKENGGGDVKLVESLNDDDKWINVLKNMVTENS
ncbi:MAG: ferrochelatase, partial [Flavobacteriales bacterium]|nr:ferrochelatase [Flavobacteriales bacterium]